MVEQQLLGSEEGEKNNEMLKRKRNEGMEEHQNMNGLFVVLTLCF